MYLKPLTCWMFWARIRSGISDGSFSMLLRTVLEAANKHKMQKSMNISMQIASNTKAFLIYSD